MENQTRFDLNAAVESWRNELAAQPNLASDDRRELETHLRDAIAGFQQRGLNDEESFWLARRRVGQPPQLGEEFVKADPAKVWRERIFWMWLAGFLSNTLGGIARSISIALALQLHQRGGSAQMAMQITVYALAGLIPIIFAVLLANGKMVALFSKLTLLVENRLRLAIAALVCIAISSSIWIMALAEITRSHFSGSVTQGLTSAFYPLMILLVLIWLMPAQNRKTPKRA
jgi:hypothetical protein